MLCCRIVNGIKNKNIKNSLGATWNASHLALFLFAFSDSLILKIGFSPKASGFYPFGDATDLAGEGGVGAVVWLIQASA